VRGSIRWRLAVQHCLEALWCGVQTPCQERLPPLLQQDPIDRGAVGGGNEGKAREPATARIPFRWRSTCFSRVRFRLHSTCSHSNRRLSYRRVLGEVL